MEQAQSVKLRNALNESMKRQLPTSPWREGELLMLQAQIAILQELEHIADLLKHN